MKDKFPLADIYRRVAALPQAVNSGIVSNVENATTTAIAASRESLAKENQCNLLQNKADRQFLRVPVDVFSVVYALSDRWQHRAGV